MDSSGGVYASGRHELAVGAPQLSFTAIGGQQKPVPQGNINRPRLQDIEAVGLLAGQRSLDPRSCAYHNSVGFRAHHFRRFVLRDALYRAVKFQDLARSEVPVISLLRFVQPSET